MLGTLGEHALESHGSSLSADVVAIDERRVAQHLRCLSEILFNLLHLFLHINGEALLVGKR